MHTVYAVTRHTALMTQNNTRAVVARETVPAFTYYHWEGCRGCSYSATPQRYNLSITQQESKCVQYDDFRLNLFNCAFYFVPVPASPAARGR